MTERLADMPPHILARFWSKVERGADNECWEWRGWKSSRGYGVFNYPDGRKRGAHRITYALSRRELRAGEVIDHLCRNRGCVNPMHLEAVSPRENTRRGDAGLHRRIERARVTHCRSGHPYTPENLRSRKDGARECRICMNEWQRAYRAKKRIATAIRNLTTEAKDG